MIKILCDSITDLPIKNIENDKVEIEDENNIKIKNIDPSSIVTVYDYKEI